MVGPKLPPFPASVNLVSSAIPSLLNPKSADALSPLAQTALNIASPALPATHRAVTPGIIGTPAATAAIPSAASASDTTLANNLTKNTDDLAADEDSIIQKLIDGSHFKTNAANPFDNLTYHWRFFATVDQEIVTAATTTASSTVKSFYEELSKYEQITIAESGVTTYAIDEVTVDATVGCDFQVESNLFTSMEMKISEPNGVNFLDAMRNCGIKLGLRNYQKSFYYLELSFKGYDNDGVIDLSPFKDLPNGGVWVWAVQVTNIDVNMSAAGGSYTLQMIPMNDSLLTGTYNIIPSICQVSGDTVGSFMDNLCTNLNTIWAQFKGDPNIITFKTQFHPVKDVMTADQVRAMPVIPDQTELQTEREIAFDSTGKTATITKGFTISRVLDSLMKAVEKAQDLAKDSYNITGVQDSKDSVNAKGYRQSIIWRIEPEVNHPNYDPLFNEYYQAITLHIYGFRVHSAQLSPQDEVSKDDIQRAIITDMAKRNFLQKRYDYLFTGINSEVLDLDLNFNLAWQAVLPRLVQATADQAAVHAKVNADLKTTNSDPRTDLNAPKTATLSTLSTPAATTPSATDSAVGAGQAADAVADAKSVYLTAVANSQAKPPTATQAQVANAKKALDDATLAVNQADYAAHVARAKIVATYPKQGDADQTSKREYAEALAAQSAKTDLQKQQAFPVSIATMDPNDATGMAGQFHPGKSIYGAILNQLYGPMARQFFQIKMTVRGDPFWIGPGGFEQAILRKTDTWDGKWPNFPEGANLFLFRMKYPLGQDDDGNIILNSNETVTGIYQVNKIQHKFQGGKFSQVLDATRVTLVDTYSSLFKSLNPSTANANPTADDQ